MMLLLYATKEEAKKIRHRKIANKWAKTNRDKLKEIHTNWEKNNPENLFNPIIKGVL